MINFAAKDEAVRERLFEERWNETTADEFEDGDEEEEPSGNTDEMTIDPDDGEASWEELFGKDEDDDGEQSGGTANGD